MQRTTQNVRLAASVRAHEQVEPTKQQIHIHYGLVILYVNVGYRNLIILSCKNRFKSTRKNSIFPHTLLILFSLSASPPATLTACTLPQTRRTKGLPARNTNVTTTILRPPPSEMPWKLVSSPYNY